MNNWTRALAEYVAALAAAEDPLTDAQLRRIVDAMRALELEHHAVLLRALERLKKAQGGA